MSADQKSTLVSHDPREIELNIEYLERKVESILSEKQKTRRSKPIVIEFCGTPKAGKTSCINSLTIFLKRNGFNVHVLTERAGNCPIKNKFDPNFNVWTGCSALMELSEILSNRPREFDVIIMDRGVFDAVCWFTWQYDHAKLDEDHYINFVNFFLAPHWTERIDLVYAFTANSDTALDREYANLLTRKRGTVMNNRVLGDYNKAIQSAVETFGGKFPRIRTIDTSGILQNDVSFLVTKGVLEALDELVSERIGYIILTPEIEALPEVFSLERLLSLEPSLEFGPRASVEANDQALQPIPVGVITDDRETKVLTARKIRSSLSKSSAENKSDLFYFGGHVRDNESDEGLTRLFSKTLRRELKEELDLDFVPNLDGAICVWDRENPRSAKHMAIIAKCDMEFETLNITADKKEFNERGLTVVTHSEYNLGRMSPERWSQVIIDEVLGWSMFKREL